MSRIHFLNVGLGDCSIIEHDDGHNTMIDVSNAKELDDTNSLDRLIHIYINNPPGNFGQKFHPVNPLEYCDERRINNFYRFILTHPDIDHMDGIKAAFEHFNIPNFWDTENNKVVKPDEDLGPYSRKDWEFYQKIRKSVNFPKVLHYPAGKVVPIGTDEQITVLAPTPELVREANESGKYNDCSYVLLYESASRKIIFAGDSEKKTWDYILDARRSLVENVDVLIAPHHGRKTGGNDTYLGVLNPKLTLIGCADSSEHLRYPSGPHFTNNQAGSIILAITRVAINVYCTNEMFAKRCNLATFYDEGVMGWFLTSI